MHQTKLLLTDLKSMIRPLFISQWREKSKNSSTQINLPRSRRSRRSQKRNKRLDLSYKCLFADKKLIQKGDTICEYEFFTHCSKPYTFAKSKIVSEVHILKFKDFQEVVQKFPEEREHYSNVRDQLIFNKKFSLLDIECILCQENDHMESQCPRTFYSCRRVQMRQKLGAIPVRHLKQRTILRKYRILRYHSLTSQKKVQKEIQQFLRFHPIQETPLPLTNNRELTPNSQKTSSSMDKLKKRERQALKVINEYNQDLMQSVQNKFMLNILSPMAYQQPDDNEDLMLVQQNLMLVQQNDHEQQVEAQKQNNIPVIRELSQKNMKNKHPSYNNYYVEKGLNLSPHASPPNGHIPQKTITDSNEETDPNGQFRARIPSQNLHNVPSPIFPDFSDDKLMTQMHSLPHESNDSNRNLKNSFQEDFDFENKFKLPSIFAKDKISTKRKRDGSKKKLFEKFQKEQTNSFNSSTEPPKAKEKNLKQTSNILIPIPSNVLISSQTNVQQQSTLSSSYIQEEKNSEIINKQNVPEKFNSFDEDCQIAHFKIYFPHNNFINVILEQTSLNDQTKNELVNILNRSKSRLKSVILK